MALELGAVRREQRRVARLLGRLDPPHLPRHKRGGGLCVCDMGLVSPRKCMCAAGGGTDRSGYGGTGGMGPGNSSTPRSLAVPGVHHSPPPRTSSAMELPLIHPGQHNGVTKVTIKKKGRKVAEKRGTEYNSRDVTSDHMSDSRGEDMTNHVSDDVTHSSHMLSSNNEGHNQDLHKQRSKGYKLEVSGDSHKYCLCESTGYSNSSSSLLHVSLVCSKCGNHKVRGNMADKTNINISSREASQLLTRSVDYYGQVNPSTNIPLRYKAGHYNTDKDCVDKPGSGDSDRPHVKSSGDISLASSSWSYVRGPDDNEESDSVRASHRPQGEHTGSKRSQHQNNKTGHHGNLADDTVRSDMTGDYLSDNHTQNKYMRYVKADVTSEDSVLDIHNKAPLQLPHLAPPDALVIDPHRVGYLRALAWASAARLPPEPWMLGGRISRPHGFSYFASYPRFQPRDGRGVARPTRHMFGAVNVNDYYPGGKFN